MTRYFDRLEQCREFRSNSLSEKELAEVGSYGQTIKELIPEYMASIEWQQHARNTQITYTGLFRRWFDYLGNVPIRKLNAKTVSYWIEFMKASKDRYGNATQRKCFKKEFDLLKSLVTWYADRKEDRLFSSPIRKFHADEYWLDTALSKKHFNAQVNDDDEIPLSEGEFARFAQEVKEGKFGELMFLLAHLQYDHSLRICEAAALMWSDIRWDKSEIKFQRHIEYIHNDRKNNPDLIVRSVS